MRYGYVLEHIDWIRRNNGSIQSEIVEFFFRGCDVERSFIAGKKHRVPPVQITSTENSTI